MNNFSNFLTKQELVYKDFRSFVDNAKLEGCAIPAAEMENRKGFIASFGFVEHIDDLYSGLPNVVNNTPYQLLPKDILHSTVSISKDPLSEENKKAIRSISTKFLTSLNNIEIVFKEVLFNADSILLAGYPNENYWNFCESIVNELNAKTDMQFRLPKMAHITLARANNTNTVHMQKAAIVKMLHEINNLTLPLLVTPSVLNIGKFTHRSSHFTFEAI